MVFLLPTAMCLRALLTNYMSIWKRSTLLTAFPGTCQKNMPKNALDTYLTHIKKWCLVHPVIHIADSDIAKPDGYIFESFGWVCDGFESTSTKNVYKKGYHVTEATVLTNSNHPVSHFSEIYSPNEKIHVHQWHYFFCYGACSCIIKKSKFCYGTRLWW